MTLAKKLSKSLRRNPRKCEMDENLVFANFYHYYEDVDSNDIIPIMGESYVWFSPECNVRHLNILSYHPIVLYQNVNISRSYDYLDGCAILQVQRSDCVLYIWWKITCSRGCDSCDGRNNLHKYIRYSSSLTDLLKFCATLEELKEIYEFVTACPKFIKGF